jgi:antitoxin YefM
MKVLTINDVRKNLAAVVDAVIDDAEECVIPRGGGQAVVIVSLDQ